MNKALRACTIEVDGKVLHMKCYMHGRNAQYSWQCVETGVWTETNSMDIPTAKADAIKLWSGHFLPEGWYSK